VESWLDILLKWFRENKRRFSWREYRDWYRVLVAEVMLIRTRSETVEKIYRGFLEKFPKPEDLCNASIEEIENFFKRIGLVNRARKLREAICLVISKYGGELPCLYEELLKLPGVGKYVARVLLTKVCRKPVPFVDGNIARFARRFLGVNNMSIEDVELWLEKAVPTEILENINIALLDFSAIICKARNPRCNSCPLRTLCSYGARLKP
jgi:A/G-specific adenine glycosylase